MICYGINKVELPTGSPNSYFGSSDYDSTKGIIYTAVSHDTRALIYQFNVTNGDNINSKFKSPSSWNFPYDIVNENNKLYIILLCPPNVHLCKYPIINNYIVIFDTKKDDFENYIITSTKFTFGLLRDPFTDR